MCQAQQQDSLSETHHGRITWCKSCRKYSLIFMTSCAVFEKDELSRFAELLCSLKVKDFNYEVAGEARVLLKNHCSTVGLCLDMLQVIELQELVNRALLIHQVYALVNEQGGH